MQRKHHCRVGGIAFYAYLLVEMSHGLGIVADGDLEVFACGDGCCRPVYGGAAATGAHSADGQRHVATVAHLVDGGHGMAEEHLAAVDVGAFCRKMLGGERKGEEKGGEEKG